MFGDGVGAHAAGCDGALDPLMHSNSVIKCGRAGPDPPAVEAVEAVAANLARPRSSPERLNVPIGERKLILC